MLVPIHLTSLHIKVFFSLRIKESENSYVCGESSSDINFSLMSYFRMPHNFVRLGLILIYHFLQGFWRCAKSAFFQEQALFLNYKAMFN